MAKISSPLTSSFVLIKKQFIDKEKLIKSSLNLQKKNADTKRRNDERERRINYENTLEKVLGFLGKPIKSLGKKLSFLDSLKQFITNVLLGFIAVRLLKYLPQLMKVFTIILKVGDFILDISGKLLNGLVTFVDKGYKAADNAKKLVGKIGGQKAIDALDSMNNQANSLLNSIIIAGMIFSDFGGVGTGAPAAKKAVDVGTEVIQETLTREAKNKAVQEAGKQATRAAIGPLGSAGIILGVGLLSSALGEGAFQIKKFGKQLRSWTTGKLGEASQDKNPITRFLKKGFFGWLSATLGPAMWILNGTGVMLDIVGAPFRYGVELIRAAIMKLNDDRQGLEKQNKNLGKFDARVRDGIREHFSILSPLFKFVGMKGVSQKLETPGSLGSLYGEKAAKDMGYYRGGLVIKKFAGGGYTRSVGDEDKKVEIPRTFNESLSLLSPGSAVGGSQSISKVFPSSPDNDTMDQYDYVVSTYNSLSGSGTIGNLTALVVKSLLGDNVNSRDYKVASNSVSSFLMNAAATENPVAYNQAFSTLGTDEFQSIVKGELTKRMDNTLGQIKNQLRIQLGLKLPEIIKTAEDMDCECPDESGGGGEVVAAEIPPEGKALLDAIAGSESRGYNSRYPSTTFSNGYKDHPRIDAPIPWRPGYTSNAAGRYQFLSTTWDGLAKKLGLKDFSPANQDRAAWQLAVDAYGYGVNGILKDLRSNPLKVANKLSGTWTSLPGGAEKNNATDGFVGRYYASVKKYQGQTPTAKIAPSSSAANVDPCVCDPEIPDATNIGGKVQAAGETAGGTISGYPITSGFGWRWGKLHGGVDVGAPEGKPIAVNVPGEVVFAGFSGDYGNVVDLWIPSLRQMFRMAHMRNTPSVKKGQKTNPGQLLGYVGSTGRSTGPHVHFESHNSITMAYGSKDPISYARYLSIGREHGGPTLTGGMRLLHKGEYVIDKDSVDLFGGMPFFAMINQVETESQRKERSSSLIKHLSKYTGRKIDERPEIIIDGEETISYAPLPIYLKTSSSYSYGGESPNWEQDILSMRG